MGGGLRGAMNAKAEPVRLCCNGRHGFSLKKEVFPSFMPAEGRGDDWMGGKAAQGLGLGGCIASHPIPIHGVSLET